MPSQLFNKLIFEFGRDVDLVADAVKKLGGYYLEPQVTRATSHVVCGDEKRTINLLRGIAFGCWIIHYDWVSSESYALVSSRVYIH